MNRDCFTDSEVFHMTRLFDTSPYFSTDKNGTVVVLQPKVEPSIMFFSWFMLFINRLQWNEKLPTEWNILSNGLLKICSFRTKSVVGIHVVVYCFRCPGEWIKGTEIRLKPKNISISELTSNQLNRLLPPIYAYQSVKRGQRKRTIISALSWEDRI